MAYVAIDCATKLTADLINGLKKEGVTHIIRYINPGWKGLTKDEVQATSDIGIKIASVFESNPTYASYFTQEQGQQDAQNASQYAKDLGQANGSAIYFTVDYDAQGKDLGAILDYFSGVAEGLDPSFKIGAYGSYAVLQYLKQHSKVEFFFQTYSWSHGQVCDFAHLYQYQNGVRVAGVNVDRDKVLNDPAAWSLPKVVEVKHEIEAEVIKANATYSIQSGDTFWDLEEKHNWKHGTLTVLNPNINARKLKVGQKINVPEAIGHNSASKYRIVEKDESLSVIANHNKISLAEIEKLNPQLKGHFDLIQPGEKVRVK